MSKFIRKGTFKIELEGGEWVECRNDIPFHELQPILALADHKVEANNVRLLMPLVEASVVGWNLKNEDGEEVPFSREMLRELDTPTMSTISQALVEKYFVSKKN